MKLGVIGGLGPIATAYFLELVISMTNASCDREHLEMIIYNCPSIPDRTEYILGKSIDSPLPLMIKIGKKLEEQGVDKIAIPCITAHYFYNELIEAIHVPIIHIVKETAAYLRKNGVKKAGILATDGTITSRLFQKELEDADINYVIPSEQSQKDVTDLIYKNIKAGQLAEMNKFSNVAKELREQGAQVIVLGCTELSLIKRDYSIGAGFLDAMEVLAKASILYCEIPLKSDYEDLITK
ncbi:MAG: cysteate racemase [Ruminiclostridium sp.]